MKFLSLGGSTKRLNFRDDPVELNKLKRILTDVTGQKNFDLPSMISLLEIEKALFNFQKAIIKNFDDLLSRILSDMKNIIYPIFCQILLSAPASAAFVNNSTAL